VSRLLQLPLEPLVDRQRAVCLTQREKILLAKQASAGTENLVLGLVLGQLDSVLTWLEHVDDTLEGVSQ
jgi:hypothetical protein